MDMEDRACIRGLGKSDNEEEGVERERVEKREKREKGKNRRRGRTGEGERVYTCSAS